MRADWERVAADARRVLAGNRQRCVSANPAVAKQEIRCLMQGPRPDGILIASERGGV